MKKFLAIVIVAAAVSAAAFAQTEFRFTYGALVGIGFGGDLDSDSKGSSFGIGFGVFLDATYASLNVGMDLVTPYIDGKKQGDSTYNYLTFGLLGKYPIALSNQLSIAPALGFDYQMFFSYKGFVRADYPNVEDMDTFVLKLGAVVDYSLSDTLYLRFQALGTYGLEHKDMKDSKIGADIKIGIGSTF